jgi:hypothetical protein
MSSQKPPSPAEDALAIFVEKMADPVERQQFVSDPSAAFHNIFENTGRSVHDIPPSVQAFLRYLSVEELAFISQLSDTLLAASLAEPTSHGRSIAKL